MKRRTFIAAIASLIAAPIAAAKALTKRRAPQCICWNEDVAWTNYTACYDLEWSKNDLRGLFRVEPAPPRHLMRPNAEDIETIKWSIRRRMNGAAPNFFAHDYRDKIYGLNYWLKQGTA